MNHSRCCIVLDMRMWSHLRARSALRRASEKSASVLTIGFEAHAAFDRCACSARQKDQLRWSNMRVCSLPALLHTCTRQEQNIVLGMEV